MKLIGNVSSNLMLIAISIAILGVQSMMQIYIKASDKDSPFSVEVEADTTIAGLQESIQFLPEYRHLTPDDFQLSFAGQRVSDHPTMQLSDLGISSEAVVYMQVTSHFIEFAAYVERRDGTGHRLGPQFALCGFDPEVNDFFEDVVRCLRRNRVAEGVSNCRVTYLPQHPRLSLDAEGESAITCTWHGRMELKGIDEIRLPREDITHHCPVHVGCSINPGFGSSLRQIIGLNPGRAFNLERNFGYYNWTARFDDEFINAYFTLPDHLDLQFTHSNASHF